MWPSTNSITWLDCSGRKEVSDGAAVLANTRRGDVTKKSVVDGTCKSSLLVFVWVIVSSFSGVNSRVNSALENVDSNVSCCFRLFDSMVVTECPTLLGFTMSWGE